MGIRDRRKREKENLRQGILDAARQLFLESGYENVSMRQIAEKIEYSPTTIYLYFRDKADLFRSICEETFAKLERELNAIATGDHDPVLGLRRGAEAYIRFGLRYPFHYQLVFMTTHPPKHPAEALCSNQSEPGGQFPFTGAAGDRSFRYLLEIISQGIKQGKFRRSDPMLLAQTAWTAMHGVTSLLITMAGFPWAERDVLIGSAVDTLLRGLTA